MWVCVGIAFAGSIVIMNLCLSKAAGKYENKYIDIEFEELNKKNT